MDQIVAALLTYGATGVAVAISLVIGVMQWRRNNVLVDALIKLAGENAKVASDATAAMNRLSDMLSVQARR